MRKKKYTARIAIACLVPLIWTGFGFALITSGIISPIPAQDPEQMPPDIYQDYVQEQELSDSFTTAWFAGITIALLISGFLFAGVFIDKHKQAN